MKYVMDTGVLSPFSAGNERVKPFFEQVQSGRAEGYAASVNLAKFHYKAYHKLGEETATHSRRQMISNFIPETFAMVS
jgi:hypothetical protein